jgi:hypothetical protein
MGLKVLAGDFQGDGWLYTLDTKQQPMFLKPDGLAGALTHRGEKVLLPGNIESLDVVTEENKKRFVGAAGWGLVGAAALGPLGALAGVLAGGRTKEVVVAVALKSGQRFLAQVDPATHKRLLALSF